MSDAVTCALVYGVPGAIAAVPQTVPNVASSPLPIAPLIAILNTNFEYQF